MELLQNATAKPAIFLAKNNLLPLLLLLLQAEEGAEAQTESVRVYNERAINFKHHILAPCPECCSPRDSHSTRVGQPDAEEVTYRIQRYG